MAETPKKEAKKTNKKKLSDKEMEKAQGGAGARLNTLRLNRNTSFKVKNVSINPGGVHGGEVMEADIREGPIQVG